MVKKLLKLIGMTLMALLASFAVLRWLGPIYALSLGFLVIAVSIVFVAVFSKAYKNWPI
jgi:hypothetical protein